MYHDLRGRLAQVGLEYLTDNNVLRYLKSYLWNIDTAYNRLFNGEKWRREAGCLEVFKHEIQNELNMKVLFFPNNFLVCLHLWKR
jgi:hypothetical protein